MLALPLLYDLGLFSSHVPCSSPSWVSLPAIAIPWVALATRHCIQAAYYNLHASAAGSGPLSLWAVHVCVRVCVVVHLL